MIKPSKIKTITSLYGIPAAIVAVFFIAVLSSIFIAISPHESKLPEGDIAPRDIYAPCDFEYSWGVDTEKTDLARKKSAENVRPVFDIDNSVEKSVREKLQASLREAKDLQNQGEIENKLVRLAGEILSTGIIGKEAKKDLQDRKVNLITVRDPLNKKESQVKVSDVLTLQDARKEAHSQAEKYFPEDRTLRQEAGEFVSEALAPDLTYNHDETDSRIKNRMEATPPIYKKVEVKKNELVIEKGTRITARHKVQLELVDKIRGATNKGAYFIGIALFLIISIVIATLYLMLAERKTYAQRKNIAIAMVVSYVVILTALLIIQSPQPSYLIPMASAGMLLVLLISFNTAFIVTLFLCIFTSVITGGSLDTFMVFMIGSMVGIYAARDARRRSQIILAGLLVGFTNFAVISYVGFLHNLHANVFLREGLWGIANGVLSSFIVLALLPIFEFVFKITTNITLLELSDLNQPLLKELTMKAPGTYHHSILVGNLAEAACEAVGANSLLARVGSYYHDIGKVEKAEYFSENEMGASSKHDKLSPSMSALIITNHVKDGIELAKKHKLDKAIIDFIAQHHGSSLIYFFYQRALEKAKDEALLKEEEFRYPGPKPQTKEAAIVLLADSVEASSRTLSDPTPARIQGLVQKIINNRFIDNQLDGCDLTLKDLNKISDAFVRVLTGVFHTRLEYPEIKKSGDKNKRKESK